LKTIDCGVGLTHEHQIPTAIEPGIVQIRLNFYGALQRIIGPAQITGYDPVNSIAD
jgi:hypothetical protein